MKSVSVFATLAFLICALPGLAADKKSEKPKERVLDSLVAGGAAFWDMGQEAFESEFRETGFEWNSEVKKTARFAGRDLTLWGEPVGETLVDFKDGSVQRVGISIYNKGDNRNIRDRKVFEAKVKDWRDLIEKKTGVPAVDRGRDKKSAANAFGYIYSDKGTTRLLEFSYQREVRSRNIPFNGEFIKLKVAETPKRDFFDRGPKNAVKVAKGDLKKRVERQNNGDVLITSVPMVDQGNKGYCVCASVERVMKYYGVQVDQHQMAQIADSTAAGTSTDAMMDALKKISGRFAVRTRTVRDVDPRKDVNGKWCDLYNRALRKYGDDFPGAREKDTREFHYTLASFNGELLKKGRESRPGDVDRFRKEIREEIDKGIPILWTLWMGYFPEEGIPQAPQSGHMRVIIGYNEKTDEVIYSDSWGAGHEEKRQPVINALTSTTGLYVLEPSK
ncbi:C39 family peptidase [Verrucomicrobiales bacterium]|nr:C39 family peptidase [Verrucomicrobiales bacterium]